MLETNDPLSPPDDVRPRDRHVQALAALATCAVLLQWFALTWPLVRAKLPLSLLAHQYLPGYLPALACGLLVLVLAWSRSTWPGTAAALIPLAVSSGLGAVEQLVLLGRYALQLSPLRVSAIALLLSAAAAVIAIVLCWKAARLRWRWEPSPFAIVVTVASMGFVVARLLPWSRYSFAGDTNALGRSAVQDCCAAFSSQSSERSLADALALTSVLVLAFALPYLVPRWTSGVAVLVQGVLLLALPISVVVPMVWGTASSADGPLTDVTVLPGAWLGLASALVLAGAGAHRWARSR